MDKKSGKISCLVTYSALGLYTVLSVYPLLWMIFNSFKNNEEIFSTNPFGIPTEFRFINYVKAWFEYDVVQYFSNSVLVTVATVFLTVCLAMMFAYEIARMDWKLSGAVKTYVSVGMFIPAQIILIPLVILVKDLHVNDTLLSVILPYVAFQTPFIITIFYGYLRQLPVEMEEAAAMDGASIYSIFLKIILPLVKPAIVSCALFTMLFSWNEFMIALVVIAKKELNTLPIGLVKFQGQFSTDWGAMAASLVISSIPTILLYLAFSQQIEKAVAAGSSIKG
ncbi:MAG: carbohydrate ABC transporter permease [Lachnospiraceae bacterium]|nr:MAG: carbohydrate ABC transporter permease [Lachnospiraceae bacterium]